MDTWQKWYVSGERWYVLPKGETVFLKRGSQADAETLSRESFQQLIQERKGTRDPFSYCVICHKDHDANTLNWVLGYTEKGPRALCPEHSPYRYRPSVRR